MKENMQKILTAFLIGFVMFFGAFRPAESAPPGLPEAGKAEWGKISNLSPLPDVGYIEEIAFESMQYKERVTLMVSKQPAISTEDQVGDSVLLKLENMFVPEELRRPLGGGKLANIIAVSPTQKTLGGQQWVYLIINLKKLVPYTIRQEEQKVFVDFNADSLTGNIPSETEKTVAVDEKNEKAPPGEQKIQTSSASVKVDAIGIGEKEKIPGGIGTPPAYTGHKISLDFQDANIKSVLRLLSELAAVNIVSGDDVKGNVTIHMEAVPWDQALDTVLSITGLAKKQTGDIITVMTLEKMKIFEAERMRPAEETLVTRVVSIDYADAKKLTENILDLLPKDKDGKVKGSVKVDEHSNALIIQATRQEMTRIFPIIEKIDKPIPQILIKANIVETTKNTARDLGIQWGGMWGQKIGSQGLYVTPGGVGGAGATAYPGVAFSGGYTPATGGMGISGQGFGVNFPASPASGIPASLGLTFGTIGGNILDVQLSALQKDGKVNILSSPSLTTLDNQKAFTESGEKIPFVTTESSGGVLTRTVKFENAVLRLEITPHVIDGKNLKMKILVQKDEVDVLGRNVDGNPYLTKKQTETNLIVQDGETIVISGLTKQTKSETINGIPWLKEIPVLGWLFKGEGKLEQMDEVLIFITPTILKPRAVAGIQTGP